MLLIARWGPGPWDTCPMSGLDPGIGEEGLVGCDPVLHAGKIPRAADGFLRVAQCCRGGVRAVPDHTAHTWRPSLGLCPLGSQLAEEEEVISPGPPPGPRRRSTVHCEAIGLPRGSSRMSQPHQLGRGDHTSRLWELRDSLIKMNSGHGPW